MKFAGALKRGIDVVGAAAGLALLSPVLAASALAVYATMGRPILFRQRRAGLNGNPFVLHKLRTMREPEPGEIYFRTGAARLTPVGRFLRSASIDELPELWNVLRGEMSLVGPRPLLVEYLDRYTAAQARRHEVRPGITGWAQVNGRDTAKFSHRLALDVWYVDHWNLRLDAKILCMTVMQVFRRTDVVHGQVPEDVDDIGLAPPPTANGVHAA
jgi:lipopolysaccharide/colanic/teichoic acid biosynthesis glycosyltransferase